MPRTYTITPVGAGHKLKIDAGDPVYLGKCQGVALTGSLIKMKFDSGEVPIDVSVDTIVLNVTTLTGTPEAKADSLAGAAGLFFLAPTGGGAATELYSESIIRARGLGSVIKAEDFSQEMITAAGHSLTNSQLNLQSMIVKVGGSYTGVKFYSGAAGVFTASNENRIGLYSFSGTTFTLVASSANDATGAFWKNGVPTLVTVPFSAPVTLAAGVFFTGLLYNSSAQTTAPAVQGRDSAANLGFMNAGGTTPLYSILNTQLTLPSTFLSTALGGTTQRPWISLY